MCILFVLFSVFLNFVIFCCLLADGDYTRLTLRLLFFYIGILTQWSCEQTASMLDVPRYLFLHANYALKGYRVYEKRPHGFHSANKLNFHQCIYEFGSNNKTI